MGRRKGGEVNGMKGDGEDVREGERAGDRMGRGRKGEEMEGNVPKPSASTKIITVWGFPL